MDLYLIKLWSLVSSVLTFIIVVGLKFLSRFLRPKQLGFSVPISIEFRNSKFAFEIFFLAYAFCIYEKNQRWRGE